MLDKTPRQRQHHARFPHRYARRRPGVGRGHDALCRAHAADVRHDDCRRRRSAKTENSVAHRRARRLALAQGAGADDIMIVNQERFGKNQASDVGGGIDIYDVSKPAAPKLITRVAHQGRRRASVRFRRPLRLHLADGGRIHRQHRDDPRSRRSGEAGRGQPLVDSRPMAGRRRGLSVGQLGHRAAIIRCATATGFMSATGTTASSFSTSPTCRSRRWCPPTTPARLFRIRRTPAW